MSAATVDPSAFCALRGHERIVIMGTSKLETAELKQMSGELRLSSMPWDVLTFLDKEDASQAAARKKPGKALGSASGW
jgi:hypothetical protein